MDKLNRFFRRHQTAAYLGVIALLVLAVALWPTVRELLWPDTSVPGTETLPRGAWGAAMELTGIREDRTGGELTWTLVADSTETVQPEAYWQLEVFRRGRWSTLGPEPWPVPDVLNPMKPGESRVYILNWADCAGALEPGYYRITQDLVRYQTGSTPEHRKCCVRFEIR